MEYGLAVVWLLAYVAIAALAYPTAATLLRSLPDRGAGFALPVALATLGLVGFWVGRLAFGPVALVAALVVLAALSGLALARGVDLDRRRFLETTAVFAVAFLFLVAVRALDPAVHPGGGEKFLDFGLLVALERTAALPPEDFWFAGEPVRYYYVGHLIAALLGDLTGTAPRYAYNLALPGFYAAFVTAAYSLAGAVAAHRGRSRVSAGAFAAFFVGLASNLATPIRALSWWVGDRTPLSLAGLDPGWATDGPAAFSYWPPSRVVEGTVTEFPLFAFLNGDLHAHMMSPPLTLLLVAVGYAYWRSPAADLRRRRLLVFGVFPPLVAVIAAVNNWSLPTALGLVWLVLALAPADPRHLLPLVGPAPDGTDAPGPVGRLAGESARVAAALGLTAVVGGVAALLAAPLLLSTTGGRGVGIVAPEDRSRLARLLVVHGVFLALVARLFAGRLASTLWTSAPADGDGPDVVTAALVAVAGVLGVAVLATLLGPVLAGVRPRVLGVVPFVLVVAVGWVLVRADARSPAASPSPADAAPRVGYETMLFVGAAGLVTVVEFLYVSDAGARYNTVFKTYAQVWALSAVAGGVVLAEYASPAAAVRRLLSSGGETSPPESAPTPDGGSPGDAPAPEPGAERDAGGGGSSVSLGGALAAALVLTLSLYGGLALVDHVGGAEGRGPATLDALRFAERDHSAEWPAVEYVRGLEGTPTLVTAPAEDIYVWSDDYWVTRRPATESHEIEGAAAPATLSGVPTLAGWSHEIGYRSYETYFDRVAVVNAIYEGEPAERVRLLAAHDVEYIYVGPAERQRYGEVTFDRLAGVEVVPESRDWEYVTLYRVDQAALGVGDAGGDGG